MKKYHFKNLMLPIAILIFFGCQQQTKQKEETPSKDYLNETKAEKDNRMRWWREAKFGMFIHWGPYAIPAGTYEGKQIRGIGEWIMNNAPVPVEAYEDFSRQFNPVAFDADEWARIASDAGMKYMVITSKHHDGFCLWDSKITNYDIMDFTTFRRDILRELKEACDKYGVKLCFYHSIMDWHHPDAQAAFFPNYNDKEKSNPNFQRYVTDYLKPQVEELVINYDPAVIWFDGEWIKDWTHENGQEMYRFLRNLNPDLIINNRVDKGRQGMQGMNKDDEKKYAGDFGTPEQEILEGTSDFDWEACMTMNDTWGYKSYDDNWKSSDTLIHYLIDIVAKGGNFLLNVGPTAEGLIPQPSVDRLAEMGDWLAINAEAVYAAGSHKVYKEGQHIRYTVSNDGKYVYAIMLKWPDNNSLMLENVIPKAESEIRLLGYDRPLSWEVDPEESELVINLPKELRDEAKRPGKYAWSLKIPI